MPSPRGALTGRPQVDPPPAAVRGREPGSRWSDFRTISSRTTRLCVADVFFPAMLSDREKSAWEAGWCTGCRTVVSSMAAVAEKGMSS